MLVKAFGPPQVIADALGSIDGISAAYIYGSWAARFVSEETVRPVNDIDVLVLGAPDRDRLYEALSNAEQRLGRPVQAAIRPSAWLTTGSGNFHATITERPLVEIVLGGVQTTANDPSC